MQRSRLVLRPRYGAPGAVRVIFAHAHRHSLRSAPGATCASKARGDGERARRRARRPEARPTSPVQVRPRCALAGSRDGPGRSQHALLDVRADLVGHPWPAVRPRRLPSVSTGDRRTLAPAALRSALAARDVDTYKMRAICAEWVGQSTQSPEKEVESSAGPLLAAVLEALAQAPVAPASR
jgi:hypothetical protein